MNKTAIKLICGLLCSNIGIGFISYSGYRMGDWTNQTMWRIMMADGIYFCLCSAILGIHSACVGNDGELR